MGLVSICFLFPHLFECLGLRFSCYITVQNKRLCLVWRVFLFSKQVTVNKIACNLLCCLSESNNYFDCVKYSWLPFHHSSKRLYQCIILQFVYKHILYISNPHASLQSRMMYYAFNNHSLINPVLQVISTKNIVISATCKKCQ